MDINQVILMGRLGKDPEVHTSNSGVTVTKFSVATSEKWKDKQGQKQEKTEWHNVVVFGPTAVWLGNNLNKGDQVLVQGKITTNVYEKDGEKKYSTQIQAMSVNILTPKQAKGSVDQGSGFAADEEIPF